LAGGRNVRCDEGNFLRDHHELTYLQIMLVWLGEIPRSGSEIDRHTDIRIGVDRSDILVCIYRHTRNMCCQHWITRTKTQEKTLRSPYIYWFHRNNIAGAEKWGEDSGRFGTETETDEDWPGKPGQTGLLALLRIALSVEQWQPHSPEGFTPHPSTFQLNSFFESLSVRPEDEDAPQLA